MTFDFERMGLCSAMLKIIELSTGSNVSPDRVAELKRRFCNGQLLVEQELKREVPNVLPSPPKKSPPSRVKG